MPLPISSFRRWRRAAALLALASCLAAVQAFGQKPKKAAPTAPDPTPRAGPWRAHLMRGYFSDYFLLDLALPRVAGLRVTSSSFTSGGWAAGQPRNPAEFYANDVMVLAGTNFRQLRSWRQEALLKWVRAGGGLFVLGGPVSFGQAGIAKTPIADLLPVELQGAFDLKRAPARLAPAPGAAAHPILGGVDLAAPMVTLFRHRARAKADATVVLGTAADPLLVVGTYGKGRVACFLGAPMGRKEDAASGETVFWDDARLPALFAGVVRHLITRPAPADSLRWSPTPKATKKAQDALERLEIGGLELGGVLDDDVGLGGKTIAGEAEAVALSKEDLNLLLREGGRPATKTLLEGMPPLIDPVALRRIEWAVRPFVGKEDFPLLLRLSDNLQLPVRQSAVALLGRSDPKAAGERLRKYFRDKNPLLLRAACRSIYEGKLRALLPLLTRTHERLKAEVKGRREGRYGGYWFQGIPPQDPAWAEAECLMALTAMGEKGHVSDACNLLFLLHIEDIKIRTFIFLYNPKVPREAEAAERHRQRNSFVWPDLTQLLERLELALATLPKPLHEEFRQALLEIDDHERMIRLLYPAYSLMAAHPTPEWQSFRPKLEAHAFELALAAKRF